MMMTVANIIVINYVLLIIYVTNKYCIVWITSLQYSLIYARVSKLTQLNKIAMHLRMQFSMAMTRQYDMIDTMS